MYFYYVPFAALHAKVDLLMLMFFYFVPFAARHAKVDLLMLMFFYFVPFSALHAKVDLIDDEYEMHFSSREVVTLKFSLL